MHVNKTTRHKRVWMIFFVVTALSGLGADPSSQMGLSPAPGGGTVPHTAHGCESLTHSMDQLLLFCPVFPRTNPPQSYVIPGFVIYLKIKIHQYTQLFHPKSFLWTWNFNGVMEKESCQNFMWCVSLFWHWTVYLKEEAMCWWRANHG